MPTQTRETFRSLHACHKHMLSHLEAMRTLLDLLREDQDAAKTRRLAGELEGFFSGTSREHHVQEEDQVFSVLLQTDVDADLLQVLRRLQQDHNWLELDWAELAPMLRAVEQGEDWVDIEHLEHAIEVFVKLSQDHIALEESMVYPQARAAEMARRLAE